ncbi:DNA-binding protein [Muribacter muris]|nr:DNA-binding protein [Muribacter muris]
MMEPVINVAFNITLDTAEVTIKEYARRTGVSIPTVKKMLEDGRLTPMPKKGKEQVMINLAERFQKAMFDRLEHIIRTNQAH